jgi:hypothetical protein
MDVRLETINAVTLVFTAISLLVVRFPLAVFRSVGCPSTPLR